MGFFTKDDDEELQPVRPKPVKQKPKRLCDGLRRDLKLCILDTDCVQKVIRFLYLTFNFICTMIIFLHSIFFRTLKERRLPIDCLKAMDVPEQCLNLAREFFECKRQYVSEHILDISMLWEILTHGYLETNEYVYL